MTDTSDAIVLACLYYTNLCAQDYSLANPDTLTKLKTAADISLKVLKAVKLLCVPNANLLELCEKGDSLLEEETAKVYKGKKISKGTPVLNSA
jgi:ERBB-3 binding protein